MKNIALVCTPIIQSKIQRTGGGECLSSLQGGKHPKVHRTRFPKMPDQKSQLTKHNRLCGEIASFQWNRKRKCEKPNFSIAPLFHKAVRQREQAQRCLLLLPVKPQLPVLKAHPLFQRIRTFMYISSVDFYFFQGYYGVVGSWSPKSSF